ncbi:MAG: AAA family ATPase [Syntrophobacteraceae bacterium]
MHRDFIRRKTDTSSASVDPEFLFLSGGHRKALEAIATAVADPGGFLVLTGESGVGKTALVRAYGEHFAPPEIIVLYLMNVEITFERLLEQMISQLGMSAAASPGESLPARLQEEYERGNKVILIVDEAQNMPVETLDLLRIFWEKESCGGKLLQVILAGEPEFEKRLHLPELKELAKIASLRSSIPPMRFTESLAYLERRLSKPSSGNAPVFTKTALKRIAKEAGGIPRVIDILCDYSLRSALEYRESRVSAESVRRAIALLRGPQARYFRGWKVAGASGLIGLLILSTMTYRAWDPCRKIPLTPPGKTIAPTIETKAPPQVKPAPKVPNFSANELIALAKTHFEKDSVKARRFLHQAIEAEPENYEGYFQLGRLLTFAGDFRRAIPQFRKALRLNDRRADIHFDLGYLYLRLGEYGRARDSYQKCLACSPPYKDEVLTNLGVVELKTGNRTKARKLFLEALRINPGDKLASKYLRWLNAQTRQAKN